MSYFISFVKKKIKMGRKKRYILYIGLVAILYMRVEIYFDMVVYSL